MLQGAYRGEIASITDAQARYRYRVRVSDIHDPSVPADHLPYGSLCTFVGKGFGDVPHYEIGDKVIVMFERGDKDHPIILGSWVTGTEDASGVLTPDYPADKSEAYDVRRKHWDRDDRDGNRLRLTEGTSDPDETSLELKSINKLVLQTTQGNLEISIAGDGTVTVQGDVVINVVGKAEIVCQEAEVTATGSIKIQSGDIQLGTAPAEQLVTEGRLATFFNAHVHTDSTPAPTTPPTVLLTPGVVSTPEVKAT